jgi:hypothetical protein
MKVSDIPEIAEDETPDKVIVTVTGASGDRKLRRADPSIVGAQGVQGETGAAGAPGAPGATGPSGGDGSLLYVARISQSGVADPVVTVLFNTIGEIAWSYGGVGVYYALLEGAFVDLKTWLVVNQEGADNEFFRLKRLNADYLALTHTLFNPATPAFDLANSIDGVSVEIRIFP